ncbi:unnamed protein product [Candidula unifasciata]|uniref:Uncharacterized protein n=1 Tax=Candidula unifasciata TaxID=100452 RepID=A0A8S3ZQ84_9EUPU|nr:unnamed protein product [Candidula unifasciata]
MANSTSSPPQRSSLSLRKTNKPLMEKRRRARINDSLTQLKSLVIQGSKKDSSQFNKLEKADILELTVKHLRNLQEQQQQQQLATCRDSTLTGKYQAGFMECANEVIRYLGQTQSFSDDVKSRVVHHLASCIQLSNKTSFAKPSQPTSVPVTTSVVATGIPTTAQFTNGQIIQVINSQFQNVKSTNITQTKVSQPVPIAPAVSSLPMTSTSIPVVITSDFTSSAASTASSRVKFTQPLHIQIPPVLSPVIIQSKATQHQKPLQPQAFHKIQDTLPQIRCTAPQETVVSSSTISPEAHTPSPPMAANHSYVYYTPEDNYVDLMPRSRTYSLTSSASSDSDLTSPLNLSQSPHYYDQKDIHSYSSALNNHFSQTSVGGNTSPSHNFPRHILYSKHFPSVIVDARKTMDSHSLKYLHAMDEDRMCFRHDGTSSPASSVGEERLWRPW